MRRTILPIDSGPHIKKHLLPTRFMLNVERVIGEIKPFVPGDVGLDEVVGRGYDVAGCVYDFHRAVQSVRRGLQGFVVATMSVSSALRSEG